MEPALRWIDTKNLKENWFSCSPTLGEKTAFFYTFRPVIQKTSVSNPVVVEFPENSGLYDSNKFMKLRAAEKKSEKL